MVSHHKSGTDAVFRALADKNRRLLLDKLRNRNGMTLGELCEGLDMTRPAVAKHLKVLQEGNLVSWRYEGRHRLHFINPLPIYEIAERWLERFDVPHLRAIAQLKRTLEGNESE